MDTQHGHQGQSSVAANRVSYFILQVDKDTSISYS